MCCRYGKPVSGFGFVAQGIEGGACKNRADAEQEDWKYYVGIFFLKPVSSLERTS